MLTVLCVLWGGALIGYLLRKWQQPWVGKILTLSIWLMLFSIGVEVGANDTLISQLGRLGFESLIVSAICCSFCAIAAKLFWKYINRNSPAATTDKMSGPAINEQKSFLRTLAAMKESFIIIGYFILGFVAGVFGPDNFLPANATKMCLYILLACVGFGLGQNKDLKRSLKDTKKSLLLLPLITMAATFAGSAVTALIFSNHSLTEWLAVGSGFGYYSLSSIIITEVKGAELGTIALLYNIMRELAAIILAPLLVKWSGPLATISVGGATTADTTLPAVSRFSGKEFVPISIFHGILVDFSVPFIVPFLCSL